MEMPMAGLLVVVTLIVAIAQIPLLLVTIPMVVWLFVVKAPLAAALWSVFLILVGSLDNILKPIFMGKNADVPMLVVFLGAIGGFIAFGFLGLFLGSIILSLGYKLYFAWLNTD
jgi:predicted PurR-regulated permease PerM